MGTDRMTIPTPEEIERLADETLVWGTYMRDAGLIRKHLHGYATALRSLATIQRERDEARAKVSVLLWLRMKGKWLGREAEELAKAYDDRLAAQKEG